MNTAMNIDRQDKSSDADQPHPAIQTIAGAKIIIADENPESAEEVKQLFKQWSSSVQLHRASSVEDLQQSLSLTEWDIVLGFSRSTQFLPAIISKQLQHVNYPTRSIFIDSNYSATNAAQIIQCGFSDYLVTGENERLIFAVAREVDAVRNSVAAQASDAVLAEANAKSELLLKSTTDAIAYVADGMLIDVNTQFVESLGYASADALELQPLIDLVTEQYQDQIRGIIKQMAVNADEIECTAISFRSEDGNETLFQLEFAAASHDGEACTQLIARPSQPGETTNISANEDNAAQTMTQQPSLDPLRALEGKGLVAFVSISKLEPLRQSIELNQYLRFGEQIDEVIRGALPTKSLTCCIFGDQWVIAKISEDEVDAHQFAENLAHDINEQIKSIFPGEKQLHAAIGVTQFGLAGIGASEAIDKAFNLSAEIQSAGGGTRVFSPRIDNAEGSAALKSAMELDRLRVKYLPTIGLQNQPEKHYEVCIYLHNDSGQEQRATEFTESLGLEKENVALDHWVINQVLSELASTVVDTPNVCVTIPLTASAIADDDFLTWLLETLKSCGLQKENFAFSVSSEHVNSYSSQAKSLMNNLSQQGFKTSISNINENNLSLVNEIQPTFAKISGELTQNLNADEETNSRATFKQLIQNNSGSQVKYIAAAVNSAAELAQLWQSGVPFVQGDYLQTPLAAMNYEFSDIA